MQHPPYRELFDFRPSAGPAPLLLILGKYPVLPGESCAKSSQIDGMTRSRHFFHNGHTKRWSMSFAGSQTGASE